MSFYNLRIPREHVYDIISILGSFNLAQLIDPKPNEFHKPFFNTIKRCEEALNKLAGIAKKAKEAGLEIKPAEDINEFLRELNRCKSLVI
jgi:hypothetical protein